MIKNSLTQKSKQTFGKRLGYFGLCGSCLCCNHHFLPFCIMKKLVRWYINELIWLLYKIKNFKRIWNLILQNFSVSQNIIFEFPPQSCGKTVKKSFLAHRPYKTIKLKKRMTLDWQWFLRYDIKSTGNKAQNRQRTIPNLNFCMDTIFVQDTINKVWKEPME